MVPARIPAGGQVRLGSVQLPDGKQLSDCYTDEPLPLLWATNEPVPDAPWVWQVLTGMHHDTGLVPILLAFMGDEHAGRPWDEGELDARCDLAAVDQLDAASVLAQAWAGKAPTPEEFESEPEFFADWFPPVRSVPRPGARPGPGVERGRAGPGAELVRLGPARPGPCCPASRRAGPGRLQRHRQQVRHPRVANRFGAALIEVDFDHIWMLVRRPPRTLPDAQAVAAELLVMCDEFWPVDKPSTAYRDIDPIAEHILRIPVWSMWWD